MSFKRYQTRLLLLPHFLNNSLMTHTHMLQMHILIIVSMEMSKHSSKPMSSVLFLTTVKSNLMPPKFPHRIALSSRNNHRRECLLSLLKSHVVGKETCKVQRTWRLQLRPQREPKQQKQRRVDGQARQFLSHFGVLVLASQMPSDQFYTFPIINTQRIFNSINPFYITVLFKANAVSYLLARMEYNLFFYSMQSKLYPNISFLTNENLSFIGSQLPRAQILQILPRNHHLLSTYTQVAQKLFSQIPVIEQMLWICKVPATTLVHIFFSEPIQYPVADCCRQPLFIQVKQDLSGCLTCNSCLKVAAKFVYTEGEGGNDKQIFAQRQRQSKSRKENLREMLTSQKFRRKKLKNNFIDSVASCQNGSFIMQISEEIIPQIVPKIQQKPLSKNLQELKDIINDIFI